MDEPLSNLDAKLRVSTCPQIAALQTRLGVTTVYVSHDQVEAMTMGDDGIGIDVAVVEELGAEAYVTGTLAGLADEAKLTAQQVVAHISSRRPPERGTSVRLGLDTDRIHVFSNANLARLS